MAQGRAMGQTLSKTAKCHDVYGSLCKMQGTGGYDGKTALVLADSVDACKGGTITVGGGYL